jgi:cell division protease FtsH
MDEKRSQLLDQIVTRREILLAAGEELKKHFIGIDDVIDKVIKSIELWYVMPELLSRPCIVCLWGMTGTGKTDLVRRLVKLLDFMDRYVEIQMTNKGVSNSFSSKTIREIIESSNIEDTTPGIILLDEIQRFRTVDQRGDEIHDYKYQDVWQLLSDGKFANESLNRKEKILEVIFDHHYYGQYEDIPGHDDEEEDEETEEQRVKRIKKKKGFYYHSSFYQAKKIKNLLKLDTEIAEIAQWDEAQKMKVLMEGLKDDKIYEGNDYSKLLVFISGNIDEAYRMAANVGDIDRDADLFAAISKKINIITVKEALTKRFKPEQIARFGNNHIIYPSLDKKSYQELIQKKVDQISEVFQNKTDIKINVEQSVLDCIYRNGVFPVQGTRPLFSTINNFYENNMPKLILPAIESDSKELNISYEDEASQLVGSCKVNTEIKYEGNIDQIRKNKNAQEHQKHLFAVHEVGHAINFALEFGLAPQELTCETAGNDSEGFLITPVIFDTKDLMLKHLVMGMGGRAAEEVVFSDKHVSCGAAEDLSKATAMAANFIRRYAMSSESESVISSPNDEEASVCNTDLERTNRTVDNMIGQARRAAKKNIEQNKALFVDLVNNLVERKSLKPVDVQEICAKYDLEIQIVGLDDEYVMPYKEYYQEFLNEVSQNQVY